jgi:hypothetical protein
METIIITENQFDRLSKSIITEQEKVKLGKYDVTLNTLNPSDPNFGTLTFDVQGKMIKIRLYTTILGNVNIVKLIPSDGGVYIKTFKGLEKKLEKGKVDMILNYVENPVGEIKLDSSLATGSLKAKKV